MFHKCIVIILLAVCRADLHSDVSKCQNREGWVDKLSDTSLFSCLSNCLRKNCQFRCEEREAASNKTKYCPVQLATGCYMFVFESMTLPNAKKTCSKYGMELLSLETKEETKVVRKHIAKIHGIFPGKDTDFAYWTSANSLLKRFTYRWKKNGTEIPKDDEDLWMPNDPNDGRSLAEERCVFIARVSKQFGKQAGKNYRIGLGDTPCDISVIKTGVICEQN